MCYVSSPCCLVECLACIPVRSFHLELQPNANSLQAALCSGFAHHPLSWKNWLTFFVLRLGKDWGIRMGSLQDILSKKDDSIHWVSTFKGFHWFIKPQVYLLSNHHWCTAQVQWVQVFTKLNITMHLNWIMSPGKSVSLLYPLAAFNFNWLPLGVN